MACSLQREKRALLYLLGFLESYFTVVERWKGKNICFGVTIPSLYFSTLRLHVIFLKQRPKREVATVSLLFPPFGCRDRKRGTMSSSMEEKASTSQASPSPTSPFAGRLDDASIELLYNELKAKDSDTLTRRSIGNSLLKVYQDLAPTPKPYHLIYPGREKEWSIFVESLFPKGSDSDALYSRQQFRALVHSWNLPSVGKVPIVVSYAKKGWDRNAHGSSFHQFFEQLRARFSTNKYRYIFILVVLCLQLSLALWQFFRFFNDRSARAAFVSRLTLLDLMMAQKFLYLTHKDCAGHRITDCKGGIGSFVSHHCSHDTLNEQMDSTFSTVSTQNAAIQRHSRNPERVCF